MFRAEQIIHMMAPPIPYFLESGYTVYQPGEEHPSRRNIGIFDLIAVEYGTLHIGEANQKWALSKGQSLILLPNQYHYAVSPCQEPTAFYWLHFHTVCSWQQLPAEQSPYLYSDTEDHNKQFLSAPYSLQLPKMWSMPYPEQAYRLFRQLLKYSAERQSSAFWSRQQIFEEMLRTMDLRQNESYASPAITVAEKAEAYIKNNYSTELNSEQMSKALHFHYNYITRCMKQVYGMTPGDYLSYYRLEQAKLKTEWSIAEIAAYVGFSSTPYFSNRFTLRNGCSPREFRKQFAL